MKHILFLLILICLADAVSAQNIYTIKADSVKLTNSNCDSTELIIENHTQGVSGFLYNTGHGRTVFKRGVMKINDSLFLIGADTLNLKGNSWIQGGNRFGTIGVLGTLDNNHLDLYTNSSQRLRLTNTGNLLIGKTTDNLDKLQIQGNATWTGPQNTGVRIWLGDSIVSNAFGIRLYGDTVSGASNHYAVIGLNLNEPTSQYNTGKQGGGIYFDDRNGVQPIRFMVRASGVSGAPTPAGVVTSGGNFLIGDVSDNGNRLQITGTAQTGASQSGAVSISQSWNTTGAPTAFKMNITNTASGTSANIMDIQQDGISRLKIPVNTAQMNFLPFGIKLQSSSGTPGGISFNGTSATGNAVYVSPGFVVLNTSGLTGTAQDILVLNAGNGSTLQPTSGNMALVNIPGNFQPPSGTTASASLAITTTINQQGGANGITRGIYINPGIVSAADFRALEVATGKSILNGKVSVNTSVSPTAGLLLGAGTATAGTAPIKLTAGTILTSPEDGAIEYDGTNYYGTQGGIRYVLAKTLTGQLTSGFSISSLAAFTAVTDNLTVTGAQPGDIVCVSANSGTSNPASVIITAYVTAANTVTIRAYNAGNSAAAIAPDTYKVRIIK